MNIELTKTEYELLMESLESYVAACEASMGDSNYMTNKLKIYRIIDNLKCLNN